MKFSVAVLLVLLSVCFVSADVTFNATSKATCPEYVFDVKVDTIFGGGALVTMDHGVVHINLSGHFEYLVGNTSGGYREGTNTDALFYVPYGVTYLSPTALLVADRDNHCIRRVDVNLTDPATLVTSTFAGQCEQEGETVGHRLGEARLKKPTIVAYNSAEGLAHGVTDNGYRIYTIDLKTDQLVTTVRTANQVTYLLYGFDQLFYTSDYAVNVIDVDDSQEAALANGRFAGDDVGSFGATRFDRVKGIASIGTNHLIVADQENDRLVALDLLTNTSSLVSCQGCDLAKIRRVDFSNEQLVTVAGSYRVQFAQVACSDGVNSWSGWSRCSMNSTNYCVQERKRTSPTNCTEEKQNQLCSTCPETFHRVSDKNLDVCHGHHQIANLIARTEIECALACKARGPWCVGFVYNSNTMQCQLAGDQGDEHLDCDGKFYKI